MRFSPSEIVRNSAKSRAARRGYDARRDPIGGSSFSRRLERESMGVAGEAGLSLSVMTRFEKTKKLNKLK